MTRDAFVIALIDVKDRVVAGADAAVARQEVGDIFRCYLIGIDCAPSMLDWAADQIHERYNDDLITVRSGFVIADELERMVRA